MPGFYADPTMLHPEHGPLDRFAAARADGFEAVEYMSPYASPERQPAEALARDGLLQVPHNLPAGDWERAATPVVPGHDGGRQGPHAECDRPAHIQVADEPGRGEPGTGGDQRPRLVRRTGPRRLPRLDRLRVSSARGHLGRPGPGPPPSARPRHGRGVTTSHGGNAP